MIRIHLRADFKSAPTLIGILFLLSFMSMIGSGMTVYAQDTPTEPVTRTAEDMAAMQKLEAELQARGGYDLRDEQVSHFEIPLTIKVGITPYLHCSQWVNAGMPVTEVIEMDFKEYVRNVLPNEWINSWHPQSLMSGAVAAKAFAWWRITLNNPRPDGADVVNNTCDQVFIRNSHKPTTDAAIDATWHYRLSRNNRIIEIHYLAHDYQCEDLGWAMCMGQWGTQEKAESGWLWQDILYHYYDPIDLDVTTTIPPNADLIVNGGFDQGADRWMTWGGIEGAGVVESVYRFYREAGSTNPAALYQDMNYRVPADTSMRVSLLLGNSSPVEKTLEVHLRKANSWDGAISCTFTLLPNLPMQKYTVYGQNPEGWVGVRLEIQGQSADDQPAYLVDKVKVMYKTKGQPDDVPECDAPRPGKPVLLSPFASSTYGKNVPVSLLQGESNLRPDYAPAYQVQVSANSEFTSTVFDNEEALSTTTQFDIPLTSGIFYLRARQFDGIDRHSRWSKAVMFNVIVLPAMPLLLSPVGDSSGIDLMFSWAEDPDTDEYKVSIKDGAGNKLGNSKFTSSVCSSGSCTVPASAFSATFSIGQSYQWKIVAKNENGKTKSASVIFTLTNATPIPSPSATTEGIATATSTPGETLEATATPSVSPTDSPTFEATMTETATIAATVTESASTATTTGLLPLP